MNPLLLRKNWEKDVEFPEGRTLTSEDIGDHSLIRVHDKNDKYRIYDLVQLYNLNQYFTLMNAHVLFLSSYAGTPKNPDCIKYKIISREEAEDFYQKPKGYIYSVEEFKKFGINNNAKLLHRRTKTRLAYISRLEEEVYMINQQVNIGHISPNSSVFIIISNRGNNIVGSYDAQLRGETWGTYEDELKWRKEEN